MRYDNENIWLTQKMLATLYDVSVSSVNQHIKRIYADHELEPAATIKNFLIVQNEGHLPSLPALHLYSAASHRKHRSQVLRPCSLLRTSPSLEYPEIFWHHGTIKKITEIRNFRIL